MKNTLTNIYIKKTILISLLMSWAYISYAQSITDQINQLEIVVSSLPECTQAEKVKKAILELALERATNAEAVAYNTEAEDLINDVLNALYQPADDYIQRNPNAEHLAILHPVLTETNNAYLDAMVSSATSAIATPDAAWQRTTLTQSTLNGFGGTYGIRSAPYTAREYFWLFAHEQSPMRFDPELIQRTLRRMHTFADLVNINSRLHLGAPHNDWFDQFAIEMAFPTFYEIAELHPNLLLPSQRKSWDNMMKAARSMLFVGGSSFGFPWNYNIETARMLGTLNVGLYLDDQAIIDRVIDHTDKAMSMQRQDGAMPYHGDDRPSVNYHNVLYTTWLSIYEQMEYEPLLEALQRSQWKGPTTGRTEEWWTSPFDKAYRWNIQKGTEAGNEAIATLTENPFVRWMIDRNQALTGVVSGRIEGRDNAVWYRPDIAAQPLPDNYTIPDKNIGGPRAWYGNFTYAGAYSGGEGHETLIGAMTVDADDGQLNSILADVTPRIWITPENEGNYSAWADLTKNGEVSATTISKNYSIGTSVHGISRRRSGAYEGPVIDWKGRQMWLGLPDRIIGLVSVVPNIDSAKAYAINGAIRLISGGSAGAETLKVLETISPNHYRYGQLDIIIHDNTYTSLTDILKPYRTAALPATELIFSNRPTEPLPAGAEESFSLNTEFRFAVEVRPTWADTNEFSSINVLGNQDLIGLEAVGSNRSFQVWLNTSSNNVQCNPLRNRLPAGDDSFVLSNGILGRVPYESTVPAQVTLEGGQHALVVVSNDTQDHNFGEASFSSMMNYSDITVVGDKKFNRVPLNTPKEITFKITNSNDPILQLTGSPKVAIEGDAAFALIQDANMTNLAYGDTATFKIRFTPTSEEKYSAIVKIPTNVAGNELYEFKITGEGSDDIILVENSAYGTSWELTSAWKNGQAAQIGSKYVVNRTENSINTLRTPHNAANAVFPGESLKIIGNGGLLLKGPNNGIIDVKQLIANYGYMSFGSGAVNYTWLGEVILEESGLSIGSSGGSMTFEGSLKGDGTITIGGPTTTFNTGTWNGDIILNNGGLSFGFDITEGGAFIYNNGIFDINERNHVFENLIINGVQTEAGIYTASELGDNFTGNGTITIEPYTTAVCVDAVFEDIIIENTLTNCTDGIDNDGDGLLDCEDPDCDTFNLGNDCDYTYPDTDNDGVCDISDVCPGFDDSLNGTPCDDGDRCTINDMYRDCNCVGIDLQDDNNNGVCDYEECNPVIASLEDANVATNTLDDDLNTYWSASGSGEFVEYCLGEISVLQAIDIAFYEGNLKTMAFDIEVSLDGVNWTSILCNASSNGTTTNFQTFTFLPVQAKKIRIIGYGNSIDNKNEITEVKLHTAIYFEAEDAYPAGIWEIENDAEASASSYVVMHQVSGDMSPTEEDALKFEFTISEAGDYNVWARKLTPTGTDDSFWIKMDDGAWEVWGGSYTSVWRWVNILNSKVYPLTAGTHTLYVHYHESGAKLDKLCITTAGLPAPVEPTDILPNSPGVYYEAECAAIVGNWEVENDTQASTEAYVVMNSGGGNPTDSTALVFDFNISIAGDYHIWARKLTPNGASDSFWIKLDDGDWEVWGGYYTSVWNWYRILGNRVYSLPAGKHTLYVHYRETEAKLDKLYIASVDACEPKEPSNLAINCTPTCTTGTLCNDGNDCTINDVYDTNCNCAGTLIDDNNDNICDCIDVQLQAWLEGVYDTNTNQMNASLQSRGLLPGQTPVSPLATPTPAGQPYSIAPWNYTGTEGANWTDTDYTGNETDWIMVSLRTGTAKNTEISRAAALLAKDGVIEFVERCALPAPTTEPLYIVLEHRNHIGIMTPQPVDIVGGILSYDFRTSDSYRDPTSFGQKQMPNGDWAMFAGDANQMDFPSFDVNGTDKSEWFNSNGVFDYYLSPDFNLDGDVNGQDKSLWFENNGISSRVPK